jgi:hypothetical protein
MAAAAGGHKRLIEHPDVGGAAGSVSPVPRHYRPKQERHEEEIMSDVMVVRQTVRVAGYRQMFMKGAMVPADHAVVKERPDLFATPEEYAASETKPQSTEDLRGAASTGRMRPGSGGAAEPSTDEAVAARQEAERKAAAQADTPQRFPCPKAQAKNCAETFDTEAGAKIHAARAHK